MGKKGREIVKLKLPELLEDLTKTYANEWLAHYNYLVAAHIAAGINSPIVADYLKKSSEGELGHANRAARRIVELGGEPIRDFAQVAAKASCPPFSLPDDPRDLNGILRAVLEQERDAIAFYQSMVDKTRATDIVTHEMFEDLLADEVAEEDELETLLGE